MVNLAVTEKALKEAEKLINCSDEGIMALSLGYNERRSENYQMAMTIRLNRTLKSLNKDIVKLGKSMSASSWSMGIMTFFLLLLTGVLVWRGLR